MNKTIIRQASALEADLINEAYELIEKYVKEGLMVSQSIEKLTEMARQKKLFIALQQNNLVACAGITFTYPDQSLEFGAWAVKRTLHNNDIGKNILQFVLKNFSERKIFALGNSHSSMIFRKLGFSELSEELVHEDVFIPCATCNCDKSHLPQEKKCSDTIFNLVSSIN